MVYINIKLIVTTICSYNKLPNCFDDLLILAIAMYK